MPEQPQGGAAIRIGEGVKGVELVDVAIRGDTGIDAGPSSEVSMKRVEIEARVGIRVGPSAKIQLRSVRFETTLADIIMHATAELCFLDTTIRALQVLVDDPTLAVPPKIADDLKRASAESSPKKKAMFLIRIVQGLQVLEWTSERTMDLLAALLNWLWEF